jgi:ELWxxDGT repeat protein
MNAKAGFLLILILALVPTAAIAAGATGVVGPMEGTALVGLVFYAAEAGPLAYFETLYLADDLYNFMPDFVRSDGTADGTFSIDRRGSQTPEESGTQVRTGVRLGNLFFFSCSSFSTPADRGLWRTDGSRNGTLPLTQGLSLGMDAGKSGSILAVPEKGLVFFSAGSRSASPDYELWATDGTPEGTRLVSDVNPEGPSQPGQMVALDSLLFFFADTPRGRELWRSDGTAAGTERVHAFPGPADVAMVRAGGALFILQKTAVWLSDGTEAGTDLVLNLQNDYQRLAAADHHLFVVDGSSPSEIWAIDADTGETALVAQAGTAEDTGLLAIGDRAVFALEDDRGREPWWSDGTPEGTHRIADLCPGPCSSLGQSPFQAYRGRAVFLADDGVSGSEPWLTDGTAAGTWRLGDLCPGKCGSTVSIREVHGWLVLQSAPGFWVSDGSPDGAWAAASLNPTGWVALPDRIVAFQNDQLRFTSMLSTLPVTAPVPPPGRWMDSPRLPGFRFKVSFGQAAGRLEPACMARTLCVSGAVPGRAEVFLRLSRQPDGRLWPAVVELSNATVDVWILQTATGRLRYYRLPGADPATPTLPGLLDREGFPGNTGGALESVAGDAGPKTPKPPGRWIESATIRGFQVQARLTTNGTSRVLRKEACAAETFCLSGATPGLTEALVRVTGPRPNGYFWTAMARFTPATLEVWVQQKKTGKIRYYRLNAPADASQLDGYLDRQGFQK